MELKAFQKPMPPTTHVSCINILEAFGLFVKGIKIEDICQMVADLLFKPNLA